MPAKLQLLSKGHTADVLQHRSVDSGDECCKPKPICAPACIPDQPAQRWLWPVPGAPGGRGLAAAALGTTPAVGTRARAVSLLRAARKTPPRARQGTAYSVDNNMHSNAAAPRAIKFNCELQQLKYSAPWGSTAAESQACNLKAVCRLTVLPSGASRGLLPVLHCIAVLQCIMYHAWQARCSLVPLPANGCGVGCTCRAVHDGWK